MSKLFGLSKYEKVKGKKTVEFIFSEGKSIKKYPLTLVYAIQNNSNPSNSNCIGVSVTKKKFKKAVDRNRIKRLLRESYRTQKNILSNQNPDTRFLLFFIYTAVQIESLDTIQKSVAHLLQTLQQKIDSINTTSNNPES